MKNFMKAISSETYENILNDFIYNKGESSIEVPDIDSLFTVKENDIIEFEEVDNNDLTNGALNCNVIKTEMRYKRIDRKHFKKIYFKENK